jgi:hypothetical protein
MLSCGHSERTGSRASCRLAARRTGRFRLDGDQLFVQQPEVVNGASDLLDEVFGKGIALHARSAVGMHSLPRGNCVENRNDPGVRVRRTRPTVEKSLLQS